MRDNRFYKQMLGILFFLTFISICFSAGYYIIELLPLRLTDYVRYLATIMTSIAIMIFIGFLIQAIHHKKRVNIYLEIIDALRKIANGDYNVQLDFKMDKKNEMTDIINHFNHMAKQLKQMEEMRQEFISNVSHEIQSPLTSIVGFAQALQNNKLTIQERNHYLHIIETESRRLSKLSDNLLKLTSLESEHHPFERTDFRLDQQIRNIILACEPTWLEKELELDISLEKVSIFADEDLMSQVWTNLIHNAIKFTQHHGRITIRLQQIDDQASITISDNGIGISETDQFHIFERFYKADLARERSKSGSGLGLSIVKRIIEMHEGTISVKSELEKGTTFTILLPIS
ncbi:HAMP domain-containing sensor histidine kinase [Peribacillus sp. NJ11]|uniref:sensor histidine kinase n=1 Tax=Peribacillus sp. NJ11 TaxID=3055861 RepID=UPI0025A259DE|nr:HAMP domain-containing sensor histidine kinase [Peribacillus sp. NJ11]MDM5220043.1 HAMP domain-containing sensor histidine kinase [Peribacillus sp. NJ11]